MFDLTRTIHTATIACALLAALPVVAQDARPRLEPVRGTIKSVEGSVVIIDSRDGRELKLITADNVVVSGVTKISLSEIKPSSFIGIAGLPQQDGSQKALSVILFPATLPQAVREELEGFGAYNLQPNSTMTNASLDRIVTVNEGNKLTVKYKNEEKTIILTPETPIVSLVPGDRSELKVGAKILAATLKRADSSYGTARVLVGRDGLTPPM